MGNVIMKAQQITYGASNVEKALDDLKAPELIELNKRMAAIDEWKANVHEVTYTGSELTIENALALPARSLITEINAIQDLHGYGHPWAGGAGKNKLILDIADIKANNTSGTWNGNVYSIANGTIEVLTDSDGNITGFKVNGTFNASVTFLVCNYNIALTADTFIFTCAESNDDAVGDSTSGSEFIGFISNVNGATQWLASTIPVLNRTFTVTDTSKLIRFAIYIASGKSVSNQILYPMIRKNTDATGFAPWENKCPISGRTEASVDDVGGNLTEDKISGCNLMSNGGIITDATFDMQIAKVKQGETYVITTDDTSGAVYGFFTSKPVQGSTSYNGTRYVTAVKTFTAPIMGYVAYRTFANYATPQCEIGTTPTPYQPYAHSSATIQLGTTVYGADINWDTGVLSITSVKIKGNSPTWTKHSTSINNVYITDTSESVKPSAHDTVTNSICSDYEHKSWDNLFVAGAIGFAISNNGRFAIANPNIETLSAFETAIADADICYELATPTTLQLTPTMLELLKGYNRVTLADGYGEIELKALVLGGDN